MYFLRSCKIIYDDFTTRSVSECDGLSSIFSMPNISMVDFLILLLCILITIYFILKIIVLFKNKEE